MNKRLKKLILLLAMVGMAGETLAQVSPLDYGLREATTGMGRYYALYNAHTDAIYRGTTVSYAGIDTLDIELPPMWRSIPLGSHTDFGGLVLTVTNNAHHGALFSMSNSAVPSGIGKEEVDCLDYRGIEELEGGVKLLLLRDQTPWTERQGYGYKVYRSDLILVVDGRGENAPVAPWNTYSTDLKATVVDVDTLPKVFENLTMLRAPGCQFRTNCISASGVCNLTIRNITVRTPRSRMIADGIFSVSNSARVRFEDIVVDGTYSGYGSSRNYGYAFGLNNLYDTRFERVVADGNWGVFGTNNLSKTVLVDCDINRFDIHCYGRDAVLKGCTLRQRQTQFSSMFGTVLYDSCRFVDCIPLRVRSSYNAYTPFDIVMKGCTFELTPRYHALVNMMLLDTADNSRPELAEKCWPNLRVEDMTVVVPWTVGRMDLFHPTGTLSELEREFGYADSVEVRGLRMVRPGGRTVSVPLRLSSRPFKTKKELKYTVE